MTETQRPNGPARGILFALPIGLAMWAVIIGGVIALVTR